MTLTAAEVAFLASPTLGAIAATEPRSVKRMINIYRLLRAGLAPADRAAFTDPQRPVYPVVAILLAAATRADPTLLDEVIRLCTRWGDGQDGAFALPIEEPTLTAFGEALEEAAGFRGGAPLDPTSLTHWAALVRRYTFHPGANRDEGMTPPAEN